MQGDYDQYEDKYEVEEAEKQLPLTKRPIFSIILVSIGFLVNFACFYITQALQFQLNESSGLCALIAFHATAFVSALFVAPGIVSSIGENFAMTISTSAFCLFTLANPSESVAALIITAIISGFFDGLLWTAGCIYVTASSTEKNRGRYFTSFYTFYSFSHLVGFFSLTIVHVASNDYYMRSPVAILPVDAKGDFDLTWMFRILGIIQFCCGAIFFFPRKLVRSTLIENNVQEFGYGNIMRILSTGGLYYYLPIVGTTAMSMTLLYADVVHNINDTMKASFALLLFGGIHCIWSIFCVKIVQVMFDSFLALVSVAVVPLAYVFCTFADRSWWYLFGAGACFGLVESSVSYALNKVCIRDYPKQIAGAMGVRIAFSSLGAMVGYILSLGCSLGVKLVIVVVFHALALAGFVIKEIRRFNLRTDFAEDADAQIRAGSYDSVAVKTAVLEQEKARSAPKKKGKAKAKGKNATSGLDVHSDLGDSYDEFSTEF